MGGISGLPPMNGDNSTSKIEIIRREKDKFEQDAFTSYKEYKHQVQTQYNEYRQRVVDNYNNYRNKVSGNGVNSEAYADAMSKPWNEYTAQAPVQSPVMNKPQTAPVYSPDSGVTQFSTTVEIQETNHPPVYYDGNDESIADAAGNSASGVANASGTVTPAPVTGPKEGENPEYDRIVNGEAAPVEGNVQADSSNEIEDTVPVENKKPDETKPAPEQENPLQNAASVKRQGVSGKYLLNESDNGKGFTLSTNMTVARPHEAEKFFAGASTMTINPKDKITKDKDGNYVFRGLKSKNYNILQQNITLASQKISMNNAIYNDLMTKQNSGTELSEAEQNFVKYHLETLKRNGLGVDAAGNLIDN